MSALRIATIIYVLFLIAAVCVYHPATAVELERLIPVETRWISKEDGLLAVNGIDVSGTGTSWEAAMEDLRASAEGIVFTESVERVVVSLEAAEYLRDVYADEKLRPSVQLYLLEGAASERLDGFTAAHESDATVENKKAIPLITEQEGRYRFAGTEQGAA